MRPRQVAGNGPVPFARAARPGSGTAAVVRVVPTADARPELVDVRGMPVRRLLRPGMLPEEGLEGGRAQRKVCGDRRGCKGGQEGGGGGGGGRRWQWWSWRGSGWGRGW